ncbi:MAG: hypothetical protein US42_C0008G0073 [Candidatus Magasanikbacteria bacterium GW2011_GWC2_37_14]|uniref:Uncharacterized protein n=1 Tax=Candidatus Magasanikbacteria bacterium GW2011_GWC2_37_14 TaxID=1619046 RepID=A0A0G0GC51_9BACT|nr:MAG: hypothetical protein US42_C0008G0073 [Candidatus Magasanikbacteria bacterium GW2011_GWC2_37_14]
MHHPQVKHTIEIFKKLFANLPPLVPPEVANEMEHALIHLQSDYLLTPEEMDNMVIAFGKKIWPYWKAFEEFYALYQGKLGEKFLLGKLSTGVKKHYILFKDHGADYKDLRMGKGAEFFSLEERMEFKGALVEIDNELRKYVQQEVLSVERTKYEDLIISFQTIFEDIEKRLGTLRLMAEDEAEHPQIASEIREQVKAFEFGLCLLGPHSRLSELVEFEDYYLERKMTKKILGK